MHRFQRGNTVIQGRDFRCTRFDLTIQRIVTWKVDEMAMESGNALRALNEDALRGLIARLQRNELDFDERLRARLPTVADPDLPAGDPLYQRLLHARRGLNLQRAEAERELARRASR